MYAVLTIMQNQQFFSHRIWKWFLWKNVYSREYGDINHIINKIFLLHFPSFRCIRRHLIKVICTHCAIHGNVAACMQSHVSRVKRVLTRSRQYTVLFSLSKLPANTLNERRQIFVCNSISARRSVQHSLGRRGTHV